MAKQDYISRYLTIIRMLRQKGEATYPEINEFLKEESEFLDRSFTVSKRTLIRDLREIRELFRIDIRFDFSKRVYYIEEDLRRDQNNRMIESMETINTLRMVSEVTKYMHFERRKAHGTHLFHSLLNAIRNHQVIRMTHQRFDSDAPRERLVEPYALKESKGRWYLLARDGGDKRIKTFGLDRILDFQSTPGRFDVPVSLDVDEMFRYCFGVINPDDAKPEEIVLSFEPEQGKYIKSYPLHESQEIITDNPKELRIKLNLFITHDLIMEILSYGRFVTVISPDELIREITAVYREAVGRYPMV